jgi:chloramphenicol-sensitive protein RarD
VDRARATRGFLYALGAYFLWGLFPVYWKQLAAVPPLALLAHRVFWSFLFVAALIGLRRRGPELLRALRDPRARRAMALSTLLISVNWFLFIYAVNTDRVLSASLGYYMNPLLNVLLGRLVLGEKLRPAQLVAVALAAAGVANLAIARGGLPWISLTLAGTFALYGLVRKTAPVESLTGLAVETGLLAPVAVGYLLLAPGTPLVPDLPWWKLLLLAGSGAATAVPLLWFAEGARRLRLTTLGVIQYVAPTCQFLLAVAYGEPFTPAHGVTFALIWSAVAIYARDALRRRTPLPAP